ncbi:putative death-receptor fusion protein-domain-containing protein [Phlyctochytrium arcticum]|nr:putative death-receptor fusion protein-domain-containing protein [Phlyctochytrium arcticum]
MTVKIFCSPHTISPGALLRQTAMRGQHFDAEAFLGERTTKDFCDRENTDFTRNALCHRSEVARISIANHIFLSSLQLDEPIDLLVDHFCYFLETSAQVNPSNGFREGVLTLTRKFYKHVRLSKRKDARRLAFTLMDRMTRGAIDNLDPLGAHSAIFFRLSLLHTLFSVYPAASKSEMVNVATVSVIQCVIHSPFELCRDLAFGWLKTYADTNALAAEHARLRSTANTLIRDIKTLTRLRGGMVWRLVGLVDRRLFPEKVFHEQEAARQLLSAFDMALSAYEIDFQAVAPTIHGVIESLSYICRDAFPSMTAATFAAALPFLSSLVTLLIRACDGALHFFEKTQFLEIGDVDHDDADWEGDNGNLRGTLIACAWRTLKTGGAILVDVVTVLAKYANVGDVQQAAESRSLVLGVGNLLMKILLEVRHWGAANWTQAGFTRFCGILSGSSDEVLQAFPQKALDDLLSMLNDDTRIIRHDERHAGLARLLLSVLNGIFPKPAARDAALRPILAKFVGMVQKATSERAKVNALNMLLWVVKDAKTGHMIPLEEMLVVCFDGLRSKEQHVRNASSVLFSSVISRFLAGDAQHSIKVGVSRNLDTFFSPRLHLCAEVLEELRRMGQGTLPPPGGQYPVLSLLSRLDAPTDMSASAPEGSAAELAKLLLVVAQRSKLWHVRELAASCFVRFARIDLLVETFVMVATDLVGGDSNYIHGNLLVLKDLSKRFTVGDVAKGKWS